MEAEDEHYDVLRSSRSPQSSFEVGCKDITGSSWQPRDREPVSLIGDESVRGYATDIHPKYNGIKEIVTVIQAIEKEGISCCVLGEAALIYYGAKRTMFDWLLCVPTEELNRTRDMIQNQPQRYEAFRPSALNTFGSLNSHFPRFKLIGQCVFFVIMSSQACHLPLSSQDIEYDRCIHIPYPRLNVYAQSLLDTWNLNDLEDLIDGMNLSIEWGRENLDLDGTVDQSWACWRETVLVGRELQDDEKPQWSRSKLVVWSKAASNESKHKRQGWKSRPGQITRFWRSGQQDPREKYKDYS